MLLCGTGSSSFLSTLSVGQMVCSTVPRYFLGREQQRFPLISCSNESASKPLSFLFRPRLEKDGKSPFLPGLNKLPPHQGHSNRDV